MLCVPETLSKANGLVRPIVIEFPQKYAPFKYITAMIRTCYPVEFRILTF